eukprot:1159506-Pelagomonas_calceolata.AAC.9
MAQRVILPWTYWYGYCYVLFSGHSFTSDVISHTALRLMLNVQVAVAVSKSAMAAAVKHKVERFMHDARGPKLLPNIR